MEVVLPISLDRLLEAGDHFDTSFMFKVRRNSGLIAEDFFETFTEITHSFVPADNLKADNHTMVKFVIPASDLVNREGAILETWFNVLDSSQAGGKRLVLGDPFAKILSGAGGEAAAFAFVGGAGVCPAPSTFDVVIRDIVFDDMWCQNTTRTFVGWAQGVGGTPPYTFELEAGSTLPTGVSLLSNGTLTGTPTDTGFASGSGFITVFDAFGCSGRGPLSLGYDWFMDAASGCLPDFGPLIITKT